MQVINQLAPASKFLVETPNLISNHYITTDQISRHLIPLVECDFADFRERKLINNVFVNVAHWSTVPSHPKVRNRVVGKRSAFPRRTQPLTPFP